MSHTTQSKLADLRAKTDRDLIILTERLIARGMAAQRGAGQPPAEALWRAARVALVLMDDSSAEKPRLARKLDLLAAKSLSACA